MSAKPFPSDLKARAEKILAQYPEKQAALLPILHLFQARDGYIVEGVSETVAEFLSVPHVKVLEVLSFYTLYAKYPQGRKHLKICRTLSCALMGGEELGELVEKKLGIKTGEVTPDGEYSFEMVECLGACEMAPMMRAGTEYIGPLSAPQLDAWLESKS